MTDYLLAPIHGGRADWPAASAVNTAPLGQRRAAILQSVVERTAHRGYPPSLREVAADVGLAVDSPSTVAYHLSALADAGLLRRDPRRPRALLITAGTVDDRGSR